jgi:hypothetical protein
MKIGSLTKVNLPGESLWVKVLNFDKKRNIMLGQINNEPVSDLHNYYFEDKVTFKMATSGPYKNCWVPSVDSVLGEPEELVH